MEAEKENKHQDLGIFGEEDDEVSWKYSVGYGLNYSSRKVFLRSYPLLWEKDIERLTLVKTIRRRFKIVVAKMLLLKKLKQKIGAGGTYFVGSCSTVQIPLFEARNKPEPLSA